MVEEVRLVIKTINGEMRRDFFEFIVLCLLYLLLIDIALYYLNDVQILMWVCKQIPVLFFLHEAGFLLQTFIYILLDQLPFIIKYFIQVLRHLLAL